MTVDEKASARFLTNAAIRKGILVKQPCSVCGTTEKVQAHHEDYSKPLEVIWLCPKDHLSHHTKARHAGMNRVILGPRILNDAPLYPLHCEPCGHNWYPRRSTPPKICPNCKRPFKAAN